MKRSLSFLASLAILLGLSANIQADEAKGTVKSVDTNRKEVVVKGVVGDTVYELNKDATVWLDGAHCNLSDLSADDRVVIVYEKRGEHYMASSVRGLRRASETTGTVNDVFMDKREVTLKGAVKNTTYELTKNGTVWVNGKKATLKEIQVGDQVLVTYEQRGDRYMANDVTVITRR